jgi:uroporphyrinogen III methyltransferase/synthase
MPKGAKVATSSPLRAREVKRLNPNVETVDIRGTIAERIQRMEEGCCDGVIVAAIALKRLGLEKYIQGIMPWEATPMQGQLAVVGRENDFGLKNLFSSIDVRKTYGKVFLVGAGPGDPELITQKGIRVLQSADCVFYDYLVDDELLQYAGRAKKIYVGKRKGAHSMPQAELNRLIRQKILEGKTVARLKGGDPLVFGRGGDEIEYLRGYYIDVEIVPGVSSATGIPSILGIPLTARDVSSSVAFVSAHTREEEPASARLIDIPATDTIVFLMGLTKLDIIIKSLYAARWDEDTPVIVISKGTRPDEHSVDGTLKDIRKKAAEAGLEPPALIVVGETVRFWQRYAKRKTCVLYTGTHPEKFKGLGRIIHFPMIEISPTPLSAGRIRALIAAMPDYDIVLVTSRFAVKYFFALIERENYPWDELTKKAFIAIGETTAAALGRYRITPGLTAKEETSEGLYKEMMEKFPMKGKRVLFPRSSLSNPYLKEHLTMAGAIVDEWIVYQNTKPQKRPLPQENIRQVLFTSPSGVRNFLEDYGRIPKEWNILSKGAATSQCLQESGYKSGMIGTH